MQHGVAPIRQSSAEQSCQGICRHHAQGPSAFANITFHASSPAQRLLMCTSAMLQASKATHHAGCMAAQTAAANHAFVDTVCFGALFPSQVTAVPLRSLLYLTIETRIDVRQCCSCYVVCGTPLAHNLPAAQT